MGHNAGVDSAASPNLPWPPTGQQVRLSHGDQQVWTVAVGAGLRSYTAAGRSLLDGYAADERPIGGRGQTLVPWPNRIAGGRYALDGGQQLALTEPAAGNAIHGLGRWAIWRPSRRTVSAVTWRCVVPPQPGWPTSLDCSVTYRLDDDGLAVTTSARNVGAVDCLYGTGSHPYLTAGTSRLDDAVVSVPAASWYATDERGIPVAMHPVDGTAYDLRAAQRLGFRAIDSTYTGLHLDGDGRWRVSMVDGDGRGVSLWGDASYRWLQVYTGDDLPEQQRRRGLAVEPMTCPPDAFNASDRKAAGVVRLAPGDEHVATWGLHAV